MKNNIENKNNPKELWDKLRAFVKKGFYPEDGSKISDAVRVKFESSLDGDNYMEEISSGFQVRDGKKYNTLQIPKEDLTNYQVTYDQKDQKLVKDGVTFSTINKTSKGEQNSQAFVMSKDGSLYLSTHPGLASTESENFTHASFLHGKPAEMAGTISINNDGKIFRITSNSGHYQPTDLDMFRGISRLNKEMPGVFTQDCKISYFNDIEKIEIPLNQFLAETRVNYTSKQNQKKEQSKEYREKLYNTVVYKFDSADEMLGLDDKKIRKLKMDLGSKKNILFQDDSNYVVDFKDLLDEAFRKKKHDFIAKLIDNSLIDVNKTVIDNKKGYSALHQAVIFKDKKLVSLLLEKGASLNSVDKMGQTPLNLAKEIEEEVKKDGQNIAAVNIKLIIKSLNPTQNSTSNARTTLLPPPTTNTRRPKAIITDTNTTSINSTESPTGITAINTPTGQTTGRF